LIKIHPHFSTKTQEIKEIISDPEYRHEIATGTFERTGASWRKLANMFKMNGCLIRQGLIPEKIYLDVYGYNVILSWQAVEEIIAILRRRLGPTVYENFEYLYMRAKFNAAKYPNGTYPRKMPQAVLKDKWAEKDAPVTQQISQ